MKNWKSTLFGTIKGGALIYAGTKIPDPNLQYALIAAGLAAIGLGAVTKDSGTVQQ